MTDDKWCPENDAAYRAELAAIHGRDNTARLRARIAALEAQVKAADGLAEAAHLLAREAHKNMRGGRGHLIDDVSLALATYRAAKEAANAKTD